MPGFCSGCGAPLPDDHARFCPRCGKPVIPGPGQQEGTRIETDRFSTTIESRTVSVISRSEGAQIVKYLIPSETIRYATRGSVNMGGVGGLRGYVTDNRVIFHGRAGVFIKKDRFHEIQLRDITEFRTVEAGSLRTEEHLRLNNLEIRGEKSDIQGLYRAIQNAKQGAG